MNEALNNIRILLVVFAIATIIFTLIVATTWRGVCDAWVKSNPVARGVFLLAVIGATLYGGAKHGSISFLYTDPENIYLINRGSYVTNDFVHVDFTVAAGVPNSATLIVERRALDMTNDVDWVTHMTTTIGEFAPPRDISFLAATNWNWAVYTTYTPGSAVTTNGVWHAYWGLDRKAHVKIVPARSCIRVGDKVIATPKSKWEYEASQEGEE